MNPGKLNRRGQFVTVEQTKTAGQDFIITYVPVPELNNGECWAQLVPLSGFRQLQAGEEVIEGTSHLYIRYRSNWRPTKAMQFIYLGQYFTIHDVQDYKQEHRYFRLIIKERDGIS